MQITAVYTLRFTFRCLGKEQYATAESIISNGAKSLNVTAVVTALPLSANEDSANRSATVHIQAPVSDSCELYWSEVQRALAFIGVEAVSP